MLQRKNNRRCCNAKAYFPPPHPKSPVVRRLRGAFRKRILDIYATKPSSWNAPFMDTRTASIRLGFCGPQLGQRLHGLISLFLKTTLAATARTPWVAVGRKTAVHGFAVEGRNRITNVKNFCLTARTRTGRTFAKCRARSCRVFAKARIWVRTPSLARALRRDPSRRIVLPTARRTTR